MVNGPRVYADADLYVSVLKDEPGAPAALSVLLAAERREIQLIASRLLSVEVGGWGGDRPGETAAAELVERFLDAVDVEWVEVDVMVAQEARRLGWVYQLRAQDAIHLATAVRRRADYFMSFDQGFPHGQVVDGTTVSGPQVVWPQTLFDQA